MVNPGAFNASWDRLSLVLDLECLLFGSAMISSAIQSVTVTRPTFPLIVSIQKKEKAIPYYRRHIQHH